MRSKVVHHHHFTWTQGWQQNLLDISAKDVGVGRCIDRHAGRTPIQAQRAQHGRCLPMAGWRFGMQAMASQGASTQTRQIGFGAAFIQEDQPRWVETALASSPRPPRPGDLRSVLLAGPERLFLYVSPMSSRR